MPKGDLLVRLTDMAGMAIPSRVSIDLDPVSGPGGAGGTGMELTAKLSGATDLRITGIQCQGGPGTQYQIRMMTDHFRPYTYFQTIREKTVNTASESVEFWVRAQEVKDIQAPGFDALRSAARRVLETARMMSLKPEDGDLLGLRGAALYARLGSLRGACFLNLIQKAAHGETAANALSFVRALHVARQDRFFAGVDPAMPEHLRRSPQYRSAPGALHDPLPGYQMAPEGSFKTRDAHANLQVTFMRNPATGELAADIDVDESTGIRHGLEVIRNAVLNKRTSPYLIREFLLAADPVSAGLNPEYGFSF